MRQAYSYKLALIAGLIGGVIEIVWLMFASRFQPIDLAEVARQTALSLYIFSQTNNWLVLWGISIHVGMSLAVGGLFAYCINMAPEKFYKVKFIPMLSIALLILIWILNFAIILPLLNPRFMALIPLGSTFVSKFLFGCGMGITFVCAEERASKLKNRSKH